MSDNVTSTPLLQTFLECGQCGGFSNISLFCKNCICSLCEDCGRRHGSEDRFIQHVVVVRTSEVLRLYGPAKIAEQCPVHKEKEISVYCDLCYVECCSSCLVEGHQSHPISTIEKKYLGAEKRLNDYSLKLSKEVRPILDRMEKQARAKFRQDDATARRVIDDINDFRKDVFQNLNKSFDSLISQVQQIPMKSNKRLNEIENAKDRVDLEIKNVDERVQRGSLDIIKFSSKTAESFIPENEDSVCTVPYFIPETNVVDVIKKSVGVINCVDEIRNDSYREIVKSVALVESKYFTEKKMLSSIIKVDNKSAWVMHSFNNRMYLYSDIGKIIKSVKINKCRGINDMAITRAGEAIFTCGDMQVRCLAVNGAVSILINTEPLPCEGICLTDTENIVLCMNDNREDIHVAIYSADGRNKLREIRGGGGKVSSLIRSPSRVVYNCQNLYVVNNGLNVVCLNEEDLVEWIYNGKEARLREYFFPSGICIDKYHNILITDLNNCCIHYLDRNGGLINVILTIDNIGPQKYRAISVNDYTGELWLGTSSGQIVIAEYLHTNKKK
ncbi:hypothetical protein FSP39_019080 [Pinctada imbricata]|uniref:B box-type domain-containing protein n=1 Tax=Pinctada imbricata TaxID=66713 RepID=A0AA89CB19_PINIB|nr:hypothetical protein FSP39_019080 [Pinctada imbricata]